MKPISSPEELMAAAIHGDLTPEERAQFETQLQNDPAARAAFQEIQAMHDLLERNHRRPDPAFEERMVSGVRRKIQAQAQPESAWESLRVLWRGLKAMARGPVGVGVIVLLIAVLLAGSFLPAITGNQRKARLANETFLSTFAPRSELAKERDEQSVAAASISAPAMDKKIAPDSVDALVTRLPSAPALAANAVPSSSFAGMPAQSSRFDDRTQDKLFVVHAARAAKPWSGSTGAVASTTPPVIITHNGLADDLRVVNKDWNEPSAAPMAPATAASPPGGEGGEEAIAGTQAETNREADLQKFASAKIESDSGPVNQTGLAAKQYTARSGDHAEGGSLAVAPVNSPKPASSVPSTIKLIRNAQLDLEVKDYQAANDAVAALVKAGGGYVDTSNSQKGGNGKLQGTMVVKLLPENLDAFLVRLRALGTVQNQSVSTEDVTKEYVDLQGRMENSQRMEAQLQDLLKRDTNKIADLLKVEQELGRVRGEIEQDQGQLKLWDFQVQYATVTIALREKDLHQAAAYLLKENDNMALYAGDVESVFAQAKAAATDCKAEILQANINRASPAEVTADVVAAVPPDQIETFLGKMRALGRVANFTRQTERVAQDGGDDNEPADQTRTEKDKALVHLTINPDDAARKQVAVAVVAPAVDAALDNAKSAALAAKAEILGSSLNKAQEGQSTAQLTVRVPGKNYDLVLAAFKALGRTSSFNLTRNDDSGPGVAGDDAPVIITLNLTDDDAPLQSTALTVRSDNVDGQTQSLKKEAAVDEVAVKASDFSRQPDGVETAQMTFRLTMAKYPAFLEKLKVLGKVETLTVERHDQPNQTGPDGDLPVEVDLTLHSQGDMVPDNGGLWATLRETFGEGAAALFGSVKTIGVFVAFLTPWAVTALALAWVARRIYVRRRAGRLPTDQAAAV